MSQTVQRDARQSGHTKVPLESLAYAMGIEWLAILGGEDVAALAPVLRAALLIGLECGVAFERLNGHRVEGDPPPAPSRLRFADDHRGAQRHQGPPNRECSCFHIEIVPTKGLSL
jgi:hypothetical protein